MRTTVFHSMLLLGWGAALLAVVQSGVVNACPFCSAPTLTLTEQYAKADAAVLVQWAGGVKPEKEQTGNTTYEIVQVLRNPTKTLEKGKPITLDRYRLGKKGDLSLLLGTRGDAIEWSSPLDVTETAYQYIVQAPSPESAAQVRLAYFLKFLEFSDQNIANDAYGEFANAPYKDIVLLAKMLPRDKLRQWVVSKDVPVTRLGLYGLMLGLCGDPADAELMERKITEPTDEYRLGIEGVISGYLLLKGEAGLDLIEKTKFAEKYNDQKVLFSETYAARSALLFMWTYGNGKIAAERLRKSLRILLDRPEMVDLVIADLARWKDWSIQSRLMDIYGVGEFNIPSVKRAIVRYMIASTKDVSAGGGAPPVHAVEGKKLLDELRKKDPKMVQDVERFAF